VVTDSYNIAQPVGNEKLHKLVIIHYNMWLRVRNLTHQRDQDDYYNPIDLSHIYDHNDILDAWFQEREQSVLREDDLHWLDEGISQSEVNRSARDGGDEGPNQRGKGIARDSSTSSGDDEDGGNGGEEVSGDDSNAEGGTYGVGGSQQDGAAMS